MPLKTSNALATQQPDAHADSLIGATLRVVVKQLSEHVAHLSVNTTISTQSASLTTVTINSMQSTQKPSGKNKKNKKKTSPSEEKPATQSNPKYKATTKYDSGEDEVVKFPCKICVEDHMAHLFPRLQECTNLLAQKDTRQTLAVLHNPFPAQ